MTWSYVKRGISTDYEDLLWKMHNDYVNVVKKPCCRLGQEERMNTPRQNTNNVDNADVDMIELPEYDVDNTLIMITALLVVGLAVWNCK